jgi:hypothetical protein
MYTNLKTRAGALLGRIAPQMFAFDSVNDGAL